MKSVVIFGTSEYARMMREYLLSDDLEVVAFCVDRQYLDQPSIDSLPVVAWDETPTLYPPESHSLFIALGYTNMNGLREQKINEAIEQGYNLQSYIHPSVIHTNLTIGDGCVCLEGVVFGNHCQIGKGNVFQVGVCVAHNAFIGDYNFFAPACAIAGDVTIENNCFLGTNCTVRNGITIQNKTLIGAGCYVDKSTDPESVWVPQRSTTLQTNSSDLII